MKHQQLKSIFKELYIVFFFSSLLRKTRIDMSVTFLSHLHFCNQNISDFTNQLTPLYYSGLVPLQVTETKFKLAETVKGIIGLCMQPRGGLGDRRMDLTVIRSPSFHLSFSPSLECSLQISFILFN